MHGVAHILRKDLRHLRLLLIVWLAIVVLQAALSGSGAANTDENLPLQVMFNILSILVPLLQFLLILVIVPLLVQDEPLVGTTAFWLTRPIRRTTLLAAKMTFILTVLVAAPLVAEMIVMTVHGVTVQDLALAIPEILLTTLASVLAVMCLASMTENFARFALAGVILGVIYILVSVAISILSIFTDPEGMVERMSDLSLINSRTVVSHLLLLVFGFGIVAYQYLTRRTFRSLVMAGLCAGASLAVNQAWPWNFLAPPHVAAAAEVNPAAVNAALAPGDLRVADSTTYRPGQARARDLKANLHYTPAPDGYFLVPDSIRAKLDFANGNHREHKGSLSPLFSMNQPDQQALRAALDGMQLLGRSVAGESPLRLFRLSQADWEKLANIPASFSATIDVKALKYEVIARLPLEKGASWKRGTDQVRIVKIAPAADGLNVALKTVSVQLLFKRGQPADRRCRALFRFQTFYVLVNPERREMVLPDFNAGFTFNLMEGQQRLNVDQMTLRFPQALDDAWLAGAQVCRVETVERGYFEKTIDLPEFVLANLRNERSGSFSARREKADAKQLAAITLPPNPDTNAVRAYIRKVLDISEDQCGCSSTDPQVRMLSEVGPQFVPVLAEFKSQFYVNEAIKRLAGPEHKDLILQRLGDQPDLIQVVAAQGWTEEARPTLIAKLRSNSEYLPPGWIRAVAEFKDPETYADLRRYFIYGHNPSDTYKAIRNLPGLDLKDAVPQAWRAAKFGGSEYAWMEMMPIALEAGLPDALDAAINQVLNDSARDPHDADRVLDAVKRATGQTGTVEQIRAWYQDHKERLVFDPAKAMFVEPTGDSAAR